MDVTYKLLLMVAFLLTIASQTISAQITAANVTETRPMIAATPDSKTTAAAATPTKQDGDAPQGGISRWIEFQTVTLSARYRFTENSRGLTTNNQLQHNEALKGRFKFDAAGRYSLHAGLFSGNNFTGSWNNTGIGTGNMASNLYLKQLFFSAQPIKGLEVQYGGLYVTRGESTEITSYDNDAYITGQRISVKRPKQLFFDEVSVTYAYLGDLTSPGINRRWRRLGQSNYHQFLVSKRLGKRAVASADYAFQSGVETLRQGIKLNTKEVRFVDLLRFENYQRLDVRPAYGFAVSGEKAVSKRLTIGGGYADIDPNYGGLNSDRFNRGKRLFASGTFALNPEFSVSAFATRGVANNFTVANRTRTDLIFSYNLLKALQRRGFIK